MNEEERWDLYDRIPTMKMKIWPDDQEREKFGKNYWEWSELLGHPPYVKSDGKEVSCQTCGRGASCILDLFFEGVIETTMYHLSELGVLNGDKE